MSHLMYNSDTDIKVTRDDMRHLRTPQPLGSRHQPYSFADFSNTVCDEIVKAGFVIDQEEFAVTKDQSKLFGLVHVKQPSKVPALSTSTALVPGWSQLVGLRGSHDQSISRGLCIGSRVMVCSNLCFHGPLGNWYSKQTTNLVDRIPSMVADAVTGLGNANRTLTVDFDNFIQAKIERDTGDAVLLDIFRRGGFSPSQLGRAVTDWDRCSVEEHMANGRNLWWLFNSCTHALKPTGRNVNHGDLQHRSTVVYSKIRGAAKDLRLEHGRRNWALN